MTYSETFSIALRASDTGLTLKAALVGTDGTIDATLRDIATGFTEHGAGAYQWRYASFADGFNGSVVFYTGTLGAASDFSGVTVKASGVAGLAELVATATKTKVEEAGSTLATILGKLAGITLLSSWLRLFARKDPGSASALSEVNTGGGTYDPTTDSLESLRDATAVGTGALSIPVTVVDGSAIVVAGSVVDVLDSGGNRLGIYGTTNSDGVVTFRLNADNYQFGVASRSGFAPHTPEAATIATDGQAVGLTVARQTATAPAATTSILGKSDPPRDSLVDIVAHVLDMFDLRPAAIDERRAVRAAKEAVKHVTTRHAWRYSNRQARVTLEAPYETGTVTVDGFTVTLSGGTWPSWAGDGVITFTGDEITDGRGWRVLERVSDSELLLESSNPTALSGVSYKLAQNTVALPSQMRILRSVHNATLDQPVTMIEASGMHQRQLWDECIPSDIRSATIATNYAHGEKYLLVSPPPAVQTVLTLDAMFDAAPAERMVRSSTNASVTIAGSVATFTGAKVPEGMGDMLLFVGSSAAAPTPEIGWGTSGYIAPDHTLRVRRRIDSTSVELYDASLVSVVDRGFILTDIIDHPRHVRLAIERFAETAMARITRRKNWNSLEEAANEELRYAIEQDVPMERAAKRGGVSLRTGHIVSEDADS